MDHHGSPDTSEHNADACSPVGLLRHLQNLHGVSGCNGALVDRLKIVHNLVIDLLEWTFRSFLLTFAGRLVLCREDQSITFTLLTVPTFERRRMRRPPRCLADFVLLATVIG